MAAITEAPLASYRIVGLRENRVGINPGTPAARMVPGGSCWHCGTSIATEVVVRHSETGEEHTIGTTCAERVGMDVTELKRWLADRYAEERHERSAEVRRQRQREREERDARETEMHGPHGTASRYISGCCCDPCRAAAPHGTAEKFFGSKCRCASCIEYVLAERSDEFFVFPKWDVIVSVHTGEVVPARKVDTRYGYRWCVNDGAAWLPVGPKRRDTLAKKGYVTAEVPMLVERCGRGRDSWLKPVARLGSALYDTWGEPLPRPNMEEPAS